MDVERLIRDLQAKKDLIPDKYDGSYKLMNTLIQEYSLMDSLDGITVSDLNAIFHMAIESRQSNTEIKKDYIDKTCLSEISKNIIKSEIDVVWDNACLRKYENRENWPAYGMFRSSFDVLNCSDKESKLLIEMLCEISKLNDDEIFDICETYLNKKIQGLSVFTASIMMHCLKPTVFPVMNVRTVFNELIPDLTNITELTSYIENCRKIKEYRDQSFVIKNYRIFDLMDKKYDDYDDGYWPSLDEYNPGITKELYKSLISDGTVIPKNKLDTVYGLYKLGGSGFCVDLQEHYGKPYGHYNVNGKETGKLIHQATNCPLYENSNFWAVCFVGRVSKEDEHGAFRWKLRKPLLDAIAELDEEGFFEGVLDMKKEIKFDKNMILYGPPGTGKTYNTVNYSVAIIENKNLENVQKEEYSEVRKRYDEYLKNGQIVFTTFHQSYGYEEFIEGIKPVFDDEQLKYTIEDGSFKKLCNSAQMPSLPVNIKSDDQVWINRIRPIDDELYQYCINNGVVRFYWEKDENYVLLNYFKDEIQPGDIALLSDGHGSTINAIGIYEDEDAYYDESQAHHHWTRKVKWLKTGLNINVKEDVGLNVPTRILSRFNTVDIKDVLRWLDMNEDNDKNYVFIIDEINRGNISKIFGELITLIEPSKRLGENEAMTAKLPYSGKTFGVPNNVYILGTMNTADRSIALMDTALRRRFSFKEMMPDTTVLNELKINTVVHNGKTLDVVKLLDTINKRIEFLYDREHTIGHAFFASLKNNPTVEELASIFEKNIIPLLQEYFYEDYEKIQLVLGDNKKSKDEYKFILNTEYVPYSVFKGSVELESVMSYSFNKDALLNIESYIEVYE